MRFLVIGAALAAATAAQAQTTYYNPRTGQTYTVQPRQYYYPPAGTGTIYISPQYQAQTGVNRYYWNGQNYRALGPDDTGGLVMGR